MIEKLVEMYQSGALTVDHLVVECLHRVDPGCYYADNCHRLPGVLLWIIFDLN